MLQQKNGRGERDEMNKMNYMEIYCQDKSQRVSPEGALNAIDNGEYD
jgi:hypothetical protein